MLLNAGALRAHNSIDMMKAREKKKKADPNSNKNKNMLGRVSTLQ